jgi:hypothetical protein
MSNLLSYIMIVVSLAIVYLCGILWNEYPEHDFIIRSFGFLLACVLVLLGIAKFKVKT